MKISKIRLENIGLMPSQEIEIKGNHVLVTGPNAQGKTTFVKAFERICTPYGKPGSMPADIVANGEARGVASFFLEDGTRIEWSKWENEPEPVVVITYPDGKQKSKPAQKLLAELCGQRVDLNKEFISTTPSDRKAFIARISGIDLEKHDKMIKVAEDNRTLVKREADTAKKRAEGYNSTIPAIPVSVTELQAAHDAIVAQQAKQEKESSALASLEQTLESNKKAGSDMVQRIDAMKAEIAALEERVQDVKKENGVLLKRIADGKAHIEANHEDLATKLESASKAISEAANTNIKIALNAKAKADYDAWIASKKQVEDAEAAVEKARAAKIEEAFLSAKKASLFSRTLAELRYQSNQPTKRPKL
jgi:predicted  nucleic acid-binding Zn-ribbon protein